MGYARTIDQFTFAELKAEIRRRYGLERAARCSYCGKMRTEPACIYKARHLNAETTREEREKGL